MAETATTSPKIPSAFALFKPSWEGLKLNLLELIIIFLVPTVVLSLFFLIVGAAAAASANNGSHIVAVVLLIIGIAAAVVYGVLLGPAIVHIQLLSARLEKATYESAWIAAKKFWWRYLRLTLAVGLLVGIGLILLIVPGIIFIRRYFLAYYVLVDQDLGVGESMKVSNQLTKGRAMAVFGIIGVDILIGLPNIIPFIGGFITLALQIVYFCAPAIRYEQLKALMPAAGKSSV